MTVTYLVATTGRPGLDATLQSIACQAQPGDQLLVVGATPEIQAKAVQYGGEFWFCPPGQDWGHTERNAAMQAGIIRGDYLVHLDDDDVAVMGARVAMAAAMAQHVGKPLIFRMQYAEHGLELWSAKVPVMGNVGTPMMVMPNVPDKLGTFGTFYGGDFQFLQTSQWDLQHDLVWIPQIIARIRPN